MNPTGSSQKRIALATLGCKVNQFESAAFLSDFEAQGVTLVPFSQPADIYVINTCAVTARAGAQSRQLVRRALRTNPAARLVVTGCYAQVAPQEVLALTEAPLCLVGNSYKHRLVEVALAERPCDLAMYLGEMREERRVCPLFPRRFGGRTRCFLRVQDGCDQFCTYCVVPFSRGRSRSVPPAAVLDQARRFAAEGFREMVLTGIHLGHYGLDLAPAVSLVELVRMLLDQNLPLRYRLSSLEPTEISAALLDLIAGSDQLMPHLHIPLQSGDDRILAAMGRSYTGSDYGRIVERCAARIPEIGIGVDVMVGFPGEDQAAFQQTRRLLESLPVSFLHVFPYSRRPGTPAADLAGQVPKRLKEERAGLLRELDQRKRRSFYRRHLGREQLVLAEGGGKRRGLLRGFTENYIPVLFRGPASLANQVVRVRLDRLAPEGGGVEASLTEATLTTDGRKGED